MTDLDPKKLDRSDYADRALASLNARRGFDVRERLGRWLGDFDPEHITLKDRYKMRTDSMIQMGLHYSKVPLITADYQFQCEDPQIAAAVKEAYDAIHIPLMRSSLVRYDFGFQACVKDWELGSLDGTFVNEDGEMVPIWPYRNVKPVMMKAPIQLLPEFTRVELIDGRFAGIRTEMRPKEGGQPDDNLVPPEHSLWFVNHFEEEFGNYYGRSRIDGAYRFWWSYWTNYHNRDRHADNDADPPLQVWYPVGKRVPDPTDIDPETNRPREVDNLAAALKIGEDLRNGATIAWPSDVYVDEQGKPSAAKLWEAAFLTGGENIGAFTDLLSDLEVSKLRATLVPEQALIQQKDAPSSRNVAGTYGEVFTESLELDSKYQDDVITRYVVRPFVEANFGKDAPICRKITTGFKEEDLSLVTNLIEAAFNADPNALPLKWSEMMERASLPAYTDKEAEEQRKAEAELQKQAAAEQAAQQAAQQPQPDAQQLMQSQGPAPRKYERERLYLHSGSEVVDAPKARGWVLKEARRRASAVDVVRSRLAPTLERQYAEIFEAAAAEIRAEGLSLSVGGFVKTILGRIGARISRTRARWVQDMERELADAYHASAVMEADRVGLDGESWDVGRERASLYASENAGELVTTMTETVVDGFLRPWLTAKFEDLGYDGRSETGVPFDADRLADELHDHFEEYPRWMAERVVRSESRMALNAGAFDLWEEAGIDELVAVDGLGGKSGKTDAACLARNGQTFTIDEARDEDKDEHPNGTLFWVPAVAAVAPSSSGPSRRRGRLLASGPYRLRGGRLRTRRLPW